MTTESFIQELKGLISKRGNIRIIQSSNRGHFIEVSTELKNLTQNCQNLLYSYTQTQPNTNTTPLVSLDNSSTLTISDLFVAHSCFHPIDPKNGLKLFFLLSLCSFSAAFAVGEDFIESSKSGASSLYLIFPNWKLKIKLPFDHCKISWASAKCFPFEKYTKMWWKVVHSQK